MLIHGKKQGITAGSGHFDSCILANARLIYALSFRTLNVATQEMSWPF